MIYPYDVTTFVRQGIKFRRSLYVDDATPPWVRDDIHGPVRDWHGRSRGNKKPGERPIGYHRDRLYDWQAATKLAREEWGCKTRKEAREAVERDFSYLHGWLSDEWRYIGVVVQELKRDKDGYEYVDDNEFGHAVWGVEDREVLLIEDVTNNLAREILYERRKLWRQALAEVRQKRFEALLAVLC